MTEEILCQRNKLWLRDDEVPKDCSEKYQKKKKNKNPEDSMTCPLQKTEVRYKESSTQLSQYQRNYRVGNKIFPSANSLTDRPVAHDRIIKTKPNLEN